MPGCQTNKFERKHDNTDIINKDFGNKMEHTKRNTNPRVLNIVVMEHAIAIPDTDIVKV